MPLLCLCLCFLVLAPPAAASANRLEALGGETRLLLDSSNLFTYPADLFAQAHFAAEIFDAWGGAALPLGQRHGVGLFFNRPTPDLGRLNTYAADAGSELFRSLEASPWLDSFYALRLRRELVLGLSGRYAYDVAERASSRASAAAADLRLGLRWGRLDAALGWGNRRLEDLAPDARLTHTDGSRFSADLRGRWRVDEKVFFLPSLAFESEAFALAPAERDFSALQLTLGLNAHPAPRVLLVGGLIGRLEKSEQRLDGRLLLEEESALIPAWVLGGEIQVGSIFFRLALRHETRAHERRFLRAGQWVDARDFDGELQTRLGLGLEFGPLRLDGLLERDFLRDGPHIIGGSRHGGGVFSRVGLIYRFAGPGRQAP